LAFIQAREAAVNVRTQAQDTTGKTALIIGATGAFGSHAAVALIKHGWRVAALARDPDAARAKAGPRMPIDWVKGDGMSAADVTAAARGVSIIVHAANPPAYRNWAGLVMPMTEATIVAARAVGARIVVPGNVYNYAPNAGPLIAEDAPQAPVTRKGKIRVVMEDRLQDVAREGVKVLILRAGDFFGPAAPNSALGWLTLRMGGKVRAAFAPGPLSVGHAYAYLPDMAETLARLLDREADLADFESFHFKGHWLARGDEMAASIRRVTGDAKVALLPFPYPVIQALSPLVETLRELMEMRYLWRKPIGLDDSKLRGFLGEVPATPLDAAMRETLGDMGCLGEAVVLPARAAVSVTSCAARV
jgi:nucleoside-diphosphate-sugar epimerase